MEFTGNDAGYWGGSRKAEMGRIGLELALRSSQQMFGRRVDPKALARAEIARKLRGMIRKDESPWVTFRRLIAAGAVTLTKRRNKPPLLRIVSNPKRTK